jgi:hypothetical protein
LLAPLLMTNCVSGGPTMLRVSLRDAVLPMPPSVVHEDWWIALKAAETSEITYLDEAVYRYRHHGANMNLGAPPAQTAELYRRELPFRRALLRGELVDLDGLTAADLAPAAARLEQVACLVATREGAWIHEVLGVTAADRAEAQDALAAGDPARALACDPADAAARAAFGLPSPPPASLDVRARVTVALVRDVLADPSLLDAYLAATGPDDDATLVLYAPGGDAGAIGPELGARVPALLTDRAPDVLVLGVPAALTTERAVLDRADAVIAPSAALAPA